MYYHHTCCCSSYILLLLLLLQLLPLLLPKKSDCLCPALLGIEAPCKVLHAWRESHWMFSLVMIHTIIAAGERHAIIVSFFWGKIFYFNSSSLLERDMRSTTLYDLNLPLPFWHSPFTCDMSASGDGVVADRDIFCAGRVTEEDLQRFAAASGGTVQTSINNIIDAILGTCELFEERQVGNERFNIFSGCPSSQTTMIVLRGGADQIIEEAERSLHDAIMIVRRAIKNSTVVAGGGAID